MRTCSTEGCGKKHKAKGYCMSCYMREYMPKWLAEPGNAEKKAESDRKLYERTRERRCAQVRARAQTPEAAARIKTYEQERGRDPEFCAGRRVRSSKWRKAHPDAKQADVQTRRARLADAPGRHNAAERDAVREQYGHRCAHCGGEEPRHRKLTIDHIVPISAGGSNWVWNLQPLCSRCNESKCDRLSELDTGKLHG